MSAFGVSCNLEKKRLHVEGVRATLIGGDLILASEWTYTAPGTFEDQLSAMFKDAEDVAKQCASTDVMIRSMDWFRQLKRDTAYKRYAAEGVLLVAFRRHAQSAACESGADCAKAVGLRKADLETRLRELVDERLMDAGSAAVAALAIAHPTWAEQWTTAGSN